MSQIRTHTELKFSGDPRFLSGIRAAVEFIAARDGMSGAEQAELGAAWEALARNCMAGLTQKNPLCKVLIDEFDDHMEVRLEHPSCATQASGAGANAGGKSQSSRSPEVMRRVDRVLYDARNGVSSVTLVKFFHKKPAAS